MIDYQSMLVKPILDILIKKPCSFKHDGGGDSSAGMYFFPLRMIESSPGSTELDLRVFLG